jgi:uncharacterized protein (TIRG00374 family)
MSNEDSSFGSTISFGKLLGLILLGVIIYLVMLLLNRWDAVIDAVASIEWWWVIPAMMGLSFLNYIIRYVKWQYYLHRIGVHISHADSFSIFLAGFTLTVSPGKVGEVIKGYFCRDVDGTPVAKTAPVVVSERLTDPLAMVVIAAFTFLYFFSGGNQILLVVIVGGAVIAGALVLTNKNFYDKILKRMTSFGPLKQFQDSFDIVEDTMVKTLSPQPLIIGTAISIPGWFMECLELWLLLSFMTDAGFPTLSAASIMLLVQATFIHASASAIGAVFIIAPGGLGAYEYYAYTAMTTYFVFDAVIATASVILIRFVTLWFSVIVGFVALGIVTHRTRERRKKEVQQA